MWRDDMEVDEIVAKVDTGLQALLEHFAPYADQDYAISTDTLEEFKNYGRLISAATMFDEWLAEQRKIFGYSKLGG